MPNFDVIGRAGERIVLMTVDSNRDISPFVFDNDGKPLWPNPLRLWKVRKAISKAINRPGIVDRVMEGNAVAAGQIATPGMFGHNPDIKPEAFDPEGAKKLLAEAGYPNGFRLTIHGPNDRYINDEKIIQAIAAMLTRVGIKTEVVTQPKAVYFGKARNGGERKTPAFSFAMVGFGTATGETMSQHWMLIHTEDKDKSLGHTNWGRYSNNPHRYPVARSHAYPGRRQAGEDAPRGRRPVHAGRGPDPAALAGEPVGGPQGLDLHAAADGGHSRHAREAEQLTPTDLRTNEIEGRVQTAPFFRLQGVADSPAGANSGSPSPSAMGEAG